MSDTKDRNRTSIVNIEPEKVIEGNEVVMRGENWPPYSSLTIKINDFFAKPTRIALGTRNGNDVLTDARGNFVYTLSTVDLKKGKHVIVISTRHKKEPYTFKGTFDILARERSSLSAERESAFGDEKEGKEQPESWYYRQLDFFNKRFKKIGFIPDGIRAFQINQINNLKEKAKQKFSEAEKELSAQPLFGPCKWNPVGSGPLVVHKERPGGFRAFAGRTLAIAIDYSSHNVMFIGTANGGIWKSMDFGFTWSPKSDFNSSLAIGSIVIDPKNPARIFAGTGEYGNTGNGMYYGSGILMSNDGGETWNNLPTSPSFQRDEISKILFGPLDSMSQHMFLSSATG